MQTGVGSYINLVCTVCVFLILCYSDLVKLRSIWKGVYIVVVYVLRAWLT